MSSNSKKLIAVIGATGQQGGAVVRALQAQGQFKVRALTRHPDKHRGLADEVVEADLDRPETLKAAFAGAHGVFLVTNFWEPGTDERKQATAAVRRGQGCRRQALYLVDAARRRSDQPRQAARSPLHRQGEGRSDREGSRLRASHVRHRAFLLPESRGSYGSAKAGRRNLGLGASNRPHSARHSHGRHHAKSAASWPAHSHTRIRQAMANICRWSAIS